MNKLGIRIKNCDNGESFRRNSKRKNIRFFNLNLLSMKPNLKLVYLFPLFIIELQLNTCQSDLLQTENTPFPYNGPTGYPISINIHDIHSSLFFHMLHLNIINFLQVGIAVIYGIIHELSWFQILKINLFIHWFFVLQVMFL